MAWAAATASANSISGLTKPGPIEGSFNRSSPVPERRSPGSQSPVPLKVERRLSRGPGGLRISGLTKPGPIEGAPSPTPSPRALPISGLTKPGPIEGECGGYNGQSQPRSPGSQSPVPLKEGTDVHFYARGCDLRAHK